MNLKSLFTPKSKYLKNVERRVLKIRQMTMNLNRDNHDYLGILDKEAYRELFENAQSKDHLVDTLIARVCVVSSSSLNIAPHDNQIMACLAMLDGKAIEMPTGEGKTLSAAMASIIKALQGQKVHLITANNYLAQRDAEDMSSLYSEFGLTAGSIL